MNCYIKILHFEINFRAAPDFTDPPLGFRLNCEDSKTLHVFKQVRLYAFPPALEASRIF